MREARHESDARLGATSPDIKTAVSKYARVAYAAREARIKRPHGVVVRAKVLGDAAKSTSAFSAKPRKVLLCLFSRW